MEGKVEGGVKEMVCMGATENLKRIAKGSEKNYNKREVWGVMYSPEVVVSLDA